MVGPKAPERFLDALADGLGAAVLDLLAILVDPKAELGRDDDPVTHGRQRLAHELLVDERAIDLGRIEEGDASIHGGPKNRDHVGRVRDDAVTLAHAHAAETNGRNLEALAQFSDRNCHVVVPQVRSCGRSGAQRSGDG